MIDHYEMPHPDADACGHAGVGKACRPCREVLDNLHRISLRDTPAGRALLAEGWEEGAAHAWAITGEGFNGECAFDHLSQRLDDPSGTFREYNPDDRNPYREARP